MPIKHIHVADDLDLIFLHVDPEVGCVEPVYPAGAFAADGDEAFEEMYVRWQLINGKEV